MAHDGSEAPGMGGTLPTLSPMAMSFTPHSHPTTSPSTTAPASNTATVRPGSPRHSTPPSLERLARDLRELESHGLSNQQRLAKMHDQRSQLLSHMSTAKAEIDGLESRLRHEESVEGSEDILIRLKELNALHEWVGYKWADLGDAMADLEAEIAVPGSREDDFWGL